MTSLAAMLRRLYSSLPSSSSSAGRLKASASGSSSSLSSPTKATRGRSKPSRAFLRSSQSATSPSAPLRSSASAAVVPVEGKGRRHRRRLLSASSTTSTAFPRHPIAKDYSWEPHHLYPASYALHRSLNPPHMPLPVHAGLMSYSMSMEKFEPAPWSSLHEPGDEAQGPFAWPQPASPVRRLKQTGESVVADHVNVTRTMCYPGLIEGLGTPYWDDQPTAGEYARRKGQDPDAHLVRILGEAVVRNTLSAGATWEDTLARLGGASNASAASQVADLPEMAIRDGDVGMAVTSDDVRVKTGEKAMKSAVEGVQALLSSLSVKEKEAEAEDLGVGMDSVRRKRKKKISKHKYKKRRKATRAQRKRLGK